MRPLVIVTAAVATAAGLLADLTSSAAAEPTPTMVVVIANPALAGHPPGARDLYAIFSGERHNWPDGSTIVALNYAPEDPLRQVMDRAVLGMDARQIGRFWVDQRIRGEAHPPREIATPQLVLRLVETLPGAIGYVPDGVQTDEVFVVARVVDGKLEADGESP